MPLKNLFAKRGGAGWRLHASTVLASAAAAINLTPQAVAQDIEIPTDGIDRVVVTGTRIERLGFEAPTPTTVSSEVEIDNSGAVNVADFLNTLPAFTGSTTPQSTVRSTQNAGGNFLNLRGLGTSRTLVLVDGRRHVPTSSSGLIDTNVIPSGLIERVDVVTGGASAAYGSDAVSGVVNMILKKDLEGFDIEAKGGGTRYGDNRNYSVSVAWGSEILDGAGHILMALDYADSQGVKANSSRPWVQEDWGQVLNPLYAAGNGQYRMLMANNVHMSTAALGGLITSGPLRGIQFTENGGTRMFNFGTSINTTNMIGGDGTNIGADQSPLINPLTRATFFSRGSYDFSDTLSGFVELSYSNSETEFPLSAHRDQAAITIRRDNAFLPEDVRQLMILNNLQTFTMGRISPDTGHNQVDDENGTERYVIGFEGDIFDSWKWDAYYEYGKTRYSARVFDNRINANYTLAIDAVLDGSGNIVCRSTLTNPTNGCQPMNLFGPGRASAEALAYVTGTQSLLSHITENAGAFNISGTPLTLWAGDVSLAAGIEYRKEEVSQTVDALSAASAYNIGNPKDLAGSYDVTEGFVELVIPLLSGLPLADQLDFNGAVRVTDYSTSGQVTSWKAGVTYDITDELRLRATQSRDIRAPNLGELYNSYVLTFSQILDPFTGVSSWTRSPSIGNPNLMPEIAETTTYGVIYQPDWAPSLRLSADFYDIQVNDVIATLSGQNIINRCYAGNTALCTFAERDGNGALIAVNRAYVNLSQFATSGVDLEASYSLDLADFSPIDGQLTFRALATYLDTFITDDGVSRIDAKGETGSDTNPEWRWLTSATYQSGPFTAFLQGQYIDGGLYDVTYGEFDINDNTVGSQFLVNGTLRYKFIDTPEQQLELFGTVQNMFDVDPPRAPSSGSLNSLTSSLYNVLGRNYVVGFRTKF